MNERGVYGKSPGQAPPIQPAKRSGWWTIGIVAALAVGIYALSPGARYFYKHGRLPEIA